MRFLRAAYCGSDRPIAPAAELELNVVLMISGNRCWRNSTIEPIDKGSSMHVYNRPLRVKRELRSSDGSYHASTCAAMEPPKGGNTVLRRDRSPRARVDVSAFGKEPAIGLKVLSTRWT
jgi:hypothetical protein